MSHEALTAGLWCCALSVQSPRNVTGLGSRLHQNQERMGVVLEAQRVVLGAQRVLLGAQRVVLGAQPLGRPGVSLSLAELRPRALLQLQVR